MVNNFPPPPTHMRSFPTPHPPSPQRLKFSATDLALTPIEKMIENVNRIARNPILAKELKLNKDDGN